MADHMAALIAVTLADGRLIFANRSFCRYFGRRRSQLIGRKFLRLLGPADRGRFARQLAELGPDHSTAVLERRTALAGGREAWHRWILRVFLDRRRQPLWYQLVARDIAEIRTLRRRCAAERRRAERLVNEKTVELERTVERLKAEVRARTEAEAAQARCERELVVAVEAERSKIGSDLHDSLGQNLAALAILSESLQRELTSRRRPEAAAARKMTRLLRNSVRLVRVVARGLSPVGLAHDSLPKNLRELAGGLQELLGVSCTFKCPKPVEVPDRETAAHLYRIAQEAASNAFKHGHSRQIEIGLARRAGRVRLTVRDNGMGLPRRTGKAEGLGRHIMSYRAHVIGATLKFARRRGGGTTVTCLLPLRKP